MKIQDPSNGQNPSSANADVILSSGEKELMLNLLPSPSPNITSYHVILDETHVANNAVTPLEFQSILAELTSIKIRATYYPFPYSSVTFEEISLETAVIGLDAPGKTRVKFVENATCHMNYTGLSCEKCAEGKTVIIASAKHHNSHGRQQLQRRRRLFRFFFLCLFCWLFYLFVCRDNIKEYAKI